MDDCLRRGKPPRYITNTEINSTFHPFGVGKSSTGLSGWGYGGARSPVSGGWQLTLCDLCELRRSETDFPHRAIPFIPIYVQQIDNRSRRVESGHAVYNDDERHVYTFDQAAPSIIRSRPTTDEERPTTMPLKPQNDLGRRVTLTPASSRSTCLSLSRSCL